MSDLRAIGAMVGEFPWLTSEQRDDLVKLSEEVGPGELLHVALARITARAVRYAVENALTGGEPAAPRPCKHCGKPADPRTNWYWIGNEACSQECWRELQSKTPP